MLEHGGRERIVDVRERAREVPTMVLKRPCVKRAHIWAERAAKLPEGQELSRKRVHIQSSGMATDQPTVLSSLLDLLLLTLLLLC